MAPKDTAQFILASHSPRRRELLDQLGLVYQLAGTDIDETPRSGESPGDYVQRMAREKAQAAEPAAGLPVLGADTIVVVDQCLLGKPRSRAQAEAMLGLLSGRGHDVITAVALALPGGECLQLMNTTRVIFRALQAGEISRYCDSGEPMDKAGAYAIQGLAAIFIRAIEGSYSGVMGLPLFETAQLLQQAGVSIPAANA